MTNSPTDRPTARKSLRLWPGVVIVILQWLGRFALPAIDPEWTIYGMFAGLGGAVAIVLWWLFFSRAPWLERVGAVVLMVVALAVTTPLLHESIATGAMGALFYLYAIPLLSLALVVWALATENLSTGLRWLTMVAALFAVCGIWTLVRTGGFTGYGDSDLAWRWSPTPEERLLAETVDVPPPPPPPAPEEAAAELVDEAEAEAEASAPEEAEAVGEGTATEQTPASPEAGGATEPVPTAQPAAGWPGFRGPERDGVVRGVRIATDWSASPPVELWRRPIGPGWSSFAVRGDLAYTQEQRGDEEIVACYDTESGEPVWMHRNAARFWESNAGAGPRATPTLHGDRVYTLGATGIVNALDAESGALVWTRDAAADTGAALPGWGFSGSPLVVGDLVVVAASGALAAYDRATGESRWLGPAGGEGYSSPQRVTIDGVEQIVQLSGDGAIGVAPSDGEVLWKHDWKGYPIVQPALTEDGDVLISVTAQSGLRRLAVEGGAGGWSVDERWTSIGLKPYFNDFVVHEGHAYGFDGGILAAIGLEDGERRWKGGRYGHGQLVLLPDQDLLLVLSEHGELALVAATPEGYRELARVPAIEGKTWNHPVLADDLLLVRNGREMAAFRLPLEPARTAAAR